MNSMKLLIIDDEIPVLDSLSDGLSMIGHECQTYQSPLQAVLAFEHQDFDAVITDYRMPGMNGAEVIRALRDMQPEVPAILISGYMDLTVAEAKKAGASACFWKPFRLPQLLEALEQPQPSTSARLFARQTRSHASPALTEKQRSDTEAQPV